MSENLRELERDALEAQRSEKYPEAIALWKRLLALNREWERGYPFYYIADCYTHIGELELAEEAYRNAIGLAPEDELFTVALSSLVEARNRGHL
jgi:tetratricopeptide (TPR) repeat protein